ncbi:MAG TPA: hypothetical protein VFR34_13580, partial [Paracoccaceae bacterium]|nr:hypothetical protein [Paracoccaceae bacterium]
ENQALRDALAGLRTKIPAAILSALATHNTAQNATAPIAPMATLPADFPVIADTANYLLPMAFPEGSPTHPAYGAGHATVAGACVTVLKAFFEMYNPNGSPRLWPYPQAFVGELVGVNGSRLVDAGGATALTVEGELDKLAANIAIGRNMAGVHYYTDYYESMRLGERIAVSILEEQLSLYAEPVSMSFTSFDGDHIRIAANGDDPRLRVVNGAGPIPPEDWYGRFAA